MKINDLLRERSKRVENVLCLGLDPAPARIPIEESSAVEASRVFLSKIVEALGDKVAAVKPNSAFFEQLGPKGIELLVDLVGQAKERGIPVILDAKRGDIGSTAKAYAKFVFDLVDADLVTLSPFLGEDSLEPFFERCSGGEKGCYLLNRTSNPGGAQFQNLLIEDGRPLYLHTTDAIARWNRRWGASIGAVVGATAVDEFDEISKAYHDTGIELPLLIPGVGTQGGDPAKVVELLRERNLLSLARVNSSSGILYAYEEDRGGDWLDACAREVDRLSRLLAL